MNNILKKNNILLFTLRAFVYTLIGVLLSTQTAYATENITYYHHDALGSPVAATDEAGNLKWREDYQPYGERIRKPTNATENNLWYTGKPEELELELQYFGARWYDSQLGRFTGIDPVGVNEGNIYSFNRYAYANNNPYGFIDPDGNHPVAVVVAVVIVWAFTEYSNTPTLAGNDIKVRTPVERITHVAGAGTASLVLKQGVKHFAKDQIEEIVSEATGGLSDLKDLGKIAKKSSADDFFAGTKYTDKVHGQMKQGDFHSFPESVTAFQDAGKVTKIKGGDGVIRDKLEIPGSYNGRDGDFEFIKESDGSINHRLFKPDNI